MHDYCAIITKTLSMHQLPTCHLCRWIVLENTWYPRQQWPYCQWTYEFCLVCVQGLQILPPNQQNLLEAMSPVVKWEAPRNNSKAANISYSNFYGSCEKFISLGYDNIFDPYWMLYKVNKLTIIARWIYDLGNRTEVDVIYELTKPLHPLPPRSVTVLWVVWDEEDYCILNSWEWSELNYYSQSYHLY